MNRFLPRAILIAALLAGGSLRVATALTKPVLFHDESHSYQAATGHVGEAARIIYGKLPPYGQWSPARAWKRLLEPERRFCFVTISRDALAYDVHPPLYYWLLHLACLAFGTHPWTGPLLNTAIDVFTLFAVYRLARYALGDRTAAAAAAFVWMLSAAALQVCVVEARQYSLLALVTVLFADQLLRLAHDPGPATRGRLLALALLTTAGALTHHHFAIPVAGALAWCMVGPVAPGRWGRLLRALGSVALGYVALVAVHPFFFGTGWKHLSDAHLPGWAGLQARGRQVLEALAQFVVERRFGSTLPAWAVALLAVIAPAALLLAAWGTWRSRRRRRPDTSVPVPDGPRVELSAVRLHVLAIGVWVMAVTVGLYLAGISPAHAMSHRYLAAAWPFVAVAIGILLAPRGDHPARPRATAALVVCGTALLVGSLSSWLQWRHLDWHPGAAEADRLVRGARRVVIDSVGRGHWPRPAFRLRDDAQVLIAAPNDLLKRPAAWRRDLEPGTVYVSPVLSARQAREKVLQSLRKDHPVRYVGHLYGIGDVYLIQ